MSVLCTWKLCLTKYIGPSQHDGAVSSAQKGAFFAKKRGTSYQQNMSLCKDAPWFAILPKSFLAERCLWSRPSARSTAGHNGTKPSSAVELQSAGKTGNLALAATCQGYSSRFEILHQQGMAHRGKMVELLCWFPRKKHCFFLKYSKNK